MENLLQSLKTGFIDRKVYSSFEYIPQFLVNDKLTGKKVLTTIDKELRNCSEFWFSVAFVTSSGIATLINTLIELRDNNIKGKILVSQYLNFTQPEALKRLLQFENIELKIAVEDNFHSKGYLFRKGELYNLIIGSSNLTANALCLNKEWNLKISASKESDIIHNALKEFANEFESAIKVDQKFISGYQLVYNKQLEHRRFNAEQIVEEFEKEIVPNAMQVEALANIKKLRSEGKNKALLISATGTGKTYLSAFDVKIFNPIRFLFIVHRANIADAALKSFKKVFGNSKTLGTYSGSKKEREADFIFATIQTISQPEHLDSFDPNYFDYIVIDETHRAGAESYQRILDHFTPKFLLGMTATPERTDGLDVFKLFDYNIAYEIRLHKAMDENMLSPFHYYGVTDITVNGTILDDNSDFTLLSSPERIRRIIEKVKLYGSDNGEVRGLIFCSRVDECKEISAGFNQNNFKTIVLSGESSEKDRSDAISRLESNIPDEKIDYIFTVDIFNEGIDIPRINQVIMLRPTQSAIIFIQQLGRGLRKTENKEYLTVIDFIGNYSNNYLVPIALYGDTSYNKDSLRKFISSGSSLIPGTSTVNFDKISRDRIYQSIDSANMQMKRDLVKDYELLKFKIGRIPLMMDFIEHGSRDPQLYVKNARSYYNFMLAEEGETEILNEKETKLLELFSNDINNSKRIEESIILRELLDNGITSYNTIKSLIRTEYFYDVSDATLKSAIINLNFQFVTEQKNKRVLRVSEIYDIENCISSDDEIKLHPSFQELLKNEKFKIFLEDNIQYSIHTFNQLYNPSRFFDGFVLYRKYSRKDVFRILNWEKNPMAQSVGGYMVSNDKLNCPIFVNYHKDENISSSTKYEDGFVSNSMFEWMTKSNRNLNSPEVKTIINYKDGLRLPLFIKKSNDEGSEFYYMGDLKPVDDSFEEDTIKNDNNESVSVVKIKFTMDYQVEETIYNYLTNNYNVRI